MSVFGDLVEDSLCVGRKSANSDEHVLLFLQMRRPATLNGAIRQKIRAHIAQTLSPRHVPHDIISVPSIPYNVNGKKLEVLVKHVLSGGEIDARTKSTLAEEDSLDFFKRFVNADVGSQARGAKL